MADVQNIEHIANDKKPIGDALESIADEWNLQKQAFYQQIGLYQSPTEGQPRQLLSEQPPPEEEQPEADNGEDFEQELEKLLSQS